MKKLKLYALLFAMSTMLFGCIGTDIVEDVIVEQSLSINDRLMILAVGESFQFEADFFDEMGEQATADITWATSDASIMSISASGLAMAVSEGDVWIRAMSGATRDSVMVSSGSMTVLAAAERTGSFVGLRDYNVGGTFTLTENGDDLEFTFSSNFVASRGPG